MQLQESIYGRKSTRDFVQEPLSEEVLNEIKGFIASAKPLYPDIKTRIVIGNDDYSATLFKVTAPHHIAVYSEEKPMHLQNLGFLLQQIDLFLSSIGLGSCWLGLGRPNLASDTTSENSLVAAQTILVFGKATNSAHRTLQDFKRNSLQEISDTADSRLEEVRLAPSSTNSQPWFFISKPDGFDAYCKKPNPIQKILTGRMSQIDMGIALAHLYVSHEQSFEVYQNKLAKRLDKHNYVCSVRI